MNEIGREELLGLAEEALDKLGVSAAELSLVQFEDNAVFRATVGEQDLMLRISFSDGRTYREQLAEQRWLEHICSAGGPIVPRPARIGGAAAVITLEFNGGLATAAIFEWIAGTADPSLDERTCRSWGRATAQLHWFSRVDRLLGATERPTWTGATVIFHGPPYSGVPFLQGAKGIVERVRGILSPMDEPSEQVLETIHADLHVGNIVRSRDGAVGIIDFDDCGFGDRVFDVATAVSSIARVSAGSFDLLTSAYLSGYLEVAPLPPQMYPFSWYLVMRDFVILNFLASTDRKDVLAWAGWRAEQITGHLNAFASTGAYPGDRAVELGLGLS